MNAYEATDDQRGFGISDTAKIHMSAFQQSSVPTDEQFKSLERYLSNFTSRKAGIAAFALGFSPEEAKSAGYR